MSPVLGIFFVILLARWVLPTLWSFMSQPGAQIEWARRGKVLGHRGPGARSFKGRAGRREWWLSTLGVTVVSLIVGAVPTIGPLLTLPWVIVTLAVNARRLHDLSLSGWLQLAPMAVGVAYAIFYFVLGGPDNAPAPVWTLSSPAGWLTALGVATGAVYLAFYAWIGFTPGRGGPNVYGEADPA